MRDRRWAAYRLTQCRGARMRHPSSEEPSNHRTCGNPIAYVEQIRDSFDTKTLALFGHTNTAIERIWTNVDRLRTRTRLLAADLSIATARVRGDSHSPPANP